MAEKCIYCGRAFNQEAIALRFTWDHIIPRSIGGANRGNKVAACGACNELKGSMMPNAMREMAAAHRAQADRMDALAKRVDELIEERGLSIPGEQPQ